MPSLLQQLRQLLEAPASAAPAAATTTAGGSSLRAAAALALGTASLPFAPATGSNGDESMASLAQQQQGLCALPDAAGVAAATASLLEDKDPKVCLWYLLILNVSRPAFLVSWVLPAEQARMLRWPCSPSYNSCSYLNQCHPPALLL